MNYKVPDFGTDGDIKSTFNSLNKAEKITGNPWNYVHPGKDAKKIPDYRTPDLGLDGDVIGTEASIAHVEKTTGKKNGLQFRMKMVSGSCQSHSRTSPTATRVLFSWRVIPFAPLLDVKRPRSSQPTCTP
jgi:hypothetical protein